MNKQYKVVIVEDDVLNVNLLEYQIKKHFPELTIVGIAQNIEDANILLNNKEIDIAFLDIRFNKRTIFELLKNNIPTFQIVFITAHKQYAINAIKTNAIDYLLKPVSTNSLISAINKAIVKCQNKVSSYQNTLNKIKNLESIKSKSPNSKILIFSNKEILIVYLHDIISLSAQRQHTIFTLVSNQKIISSKNLGEYLKIISSPLFFRIHKSHVINLHHLIKIEKITKQCILRNNKLLPISQRRYHELLGFLNA